MGKKYGNNKTNERERRGLMLSKQIFNKSFLMILMVNDIQIDMVKNSTFYNLMKNDFNDDEFECICEKICKEENLYGKYPTPSMFYKFKKNGIDVMNIECQKFLGKVEDYLRLGFVPSFYKEDFINGLTESERSALQGFGGISELWASCHRVEYSKSISAILKELKDSFNMCWKIEEKFDTPLIENQKDMAQIEDVKKLLSTVKLGG